jgi:hypothetical protein
MERLTYSEYQSPRFPDLSRVFDQSGMRLRRRKLRPRSRLAGEPSSAVPMFDHGPMGAVMPTRNNSAIPCAHD